MKRCFIFALALWLPWYLNAESQKIPTGDENSSVEFYTTQEAIDENSYIVPEGHVGYVINLPSWITAYTCVGGYDGCKAGPTQVAWRWRYGRRVIPINVRPNTYSEYFQIMTKDKLRVSFRVHALLKVKDLTEEPDSIKNVVEKFGGQHWYRTVVQARFRTFVRSAVLMHDAADLNDQEKLTTIEQAILDELTAFVDKEKMPIEVQQVNIGNFHFPDSLADEIEQTQVMNQRLLTKQKELEVTTKEGEIMVTKARNAAEAQEAQQRSLTPLYVQLESLRVMEKMAGSPNKTIIYVPVGQNGLPIVVPSGTPMEAERR